MTVDTAPAARAAERIRRFGKRRPEALALARYASLAVRVDSPLLRSLRLEFLPGADAGVEADLWFSPLTESVSSQGFVLDPHVADQLRRELAAVVVGDEQPALDRAARITAAAHRDWPPSLKLEEEITRVALKRQTQSDEVEALLRQLAKAMAEDTTRGTEIARWAQRALSRLPQMARETEAALLLALGATERLGVTVALPEGDRAGALPERAGWILPTPKFSRETKIGLRRYAEGIEFLAPDQAPLTFDLPLTKPLYVQLSWLEDTTRSTQTVSVAPGRKIAIPTHAVEIRIRTIAGRELALESVTSATPGAAAETGDTFDLTRAGVLVRVYQQARPDEPFECAGFFVARDAVATIVPIEWAGAGDRCQILWRNQRIAARVASLDQTTRAALVRLEHEAEDCVVLAREDDVSALKPGDVWQSIVFHGADALVVDGTIQSLASTVRIHRETVRGLMQLAVGPTLRDAVMGRAVVTGSPVVISGRVAAQMLASAVGSDGTFAYARAIGPAGQFMGDTPVTRGVEPSVFLVFSWKDADSATMDRIRNALARASLQEVFVGAEDLLRRIQPINDSDGAALVLTSATGESAWVAVEARSVAYRQWVNPDFPVAIFRTAHRKDQAGAGGLGTVVDVPVPALRRLQACDLDQSSDESVLAYTRRCFAPLYRSNDENAGLERVTARVRGLLDEVFRASVEPKSVASILANGVHAPFPWEETLRSLGAEQGEELVNIATMFSFPPDTHRPLLDLARGAPDARVFVANAAPINVAKALIRRAWIGQSPPRWILFRHQRWEEMSDPQQVLARVAEAVAEDLECDVTEARQLVAELRGPLILIFTTRPVPPVPYLTDLLRSLPQSFIFFFLAGRDVSGAWPGELGIAELPRLPEGEDFRFLNQYKRLMEIVSPRGATADKVAPQKKAVARPKPKKTVKSRKAVTQRPRRKTSKKK